VAVRELQLLPYENGLTTGEALDLIDASIGYTLDTGRSGGAVSVVRRMSARDAREHFADVIGSVYYGHEPVIVERNGKPFAVVISPGQYEAMRKEIDRAWKTVDDLRDRNADEDPEDVLEYVTAVVDEVRRERSGRRETDAPRRDR
jgi:prevent-host-death family protein